MNTNTTPKTKACIPQKKQYKVTNWKEYNASLVARGSVTLWFSTDVLTAWNKPVQSGKAGHPKTYSDIAIQTALTIQAIYHLPLRATEGFVQSLLFMLGCAHLKSPDYSTLSYRAEDLTVPMSARVKAALRAGEGLHIAIDSTGVKLYGEGEWKVRKHGWSKRRTWRKVHLGVDVSSNLIPTGALTDSSIADGHMVEPLLDAMPDECRTATIYGDGAYDLWDIYDLCHERGITLLAPPRANARDQYYAPGEPQHHPSQTIRNKAVLYAEQHGITAWKHDSGYHKRSLSETAMYRFKTIFGQNITARTLRRQQTQVKIRIHALNELTLLGMPKTIVVT
ncbi:MAG: IS5 family transposase [Candidatus Saccharimonadales bacterium]|jgi:hypothetical protein